ncbi:MAG: DNA-processing protein DprA [Pseudomonadales bacterium]|jgi:DNA processing protein|nr:DNA-processing protein DprA [Pseudomonadales bacterium]
MDGQDDALTLLHTWLLLSLQTTLNAAKLKESCAQGWNAHTAAATLRKINKDELCKAQRQLPRVLEWLAQEGNALLPLYAPDYPPLLAALHDPPPVLYLQGRQEALSLPQMAIVGTRKPSADGRRLAREFGAALVQSGYVVTSGLALGVDAESHAGALAQGGLTVAVLGSGLEQLYPKANRELAARIRAQGALVSEFPPWVAPADWHFPLRNRVISGLSHGVLVVEAAARSGSLITARLAAEQGREVFAIPGSIYNSQTHGCHALLRGGAKLVETLADILEELPAFTAWERQRLVPDTPPAAVAATPAMAQKSDDSLSMEDQQILMALGHGTISLEQLMGVLGLPVEALLERLSELELRGLVMASPGGFSCRN